MKIDEIGKFFEAYLVYERHFAELTVVVYLSDVRQFLDYCATAKKLVVIYEINAVVLRDYRLNMHSNSILVRTMARKLSSIKEFFSFLHMRYNFENFEFTIPRFEKTLPKYFSIDEINSILDYIEHNESLEINTIFKILYGSGIRVSELCKIKIDHIQNTSILIEGKGAKQRLVPIPKIIIPKLNEYLENRKVRLGSRFFDYMFFKERKNILYKYERFDINYILNKIGRKLGIKLNPHKLRHSLATHFLFNDLPLIHIQRILGHESVVTTSIYTHLDTRTLRKAYDKFHPRAGKLWDGTT